MTTNVGTGINESATVTFPAADDIVQARAVALVVDNGAVKLPAAGANAIGISILETEEKIVKGEDVDIQIKDIGKWTAAEAVKAGNELATDAAGKAVKAKSGDFIIGIALNDVVTAGSYVAVQITKSGYKA